MMVINRNFISGEPVTTDHTFINSHGERLELIEPLDLIRGLKLIKKAQGEWADLSIETRLTQLTQALNEILKLEQTILGNLSTGNGVSESFAKRYFFEATVAEVKTGLSRPDYDFLPLGLVVLVAPGMADLRLILPRLFLALLMGNAVIIKGSKKLRWSFRQSLVRYLNIFRRA